MNVCVRVTIKTFYLYLKIFANVNEVYKIINANAYVPVIMAMVVSEKIGKINFVI